MSSQRFALAFAAAAGLMGFARAEEYVIDVPAGTIVSNTTDDINAVTAGDVLVKTGKGTYYMNRKIGDTRNFSEFVVREGTVEYAGATSYFQPTKITVKSGAAFLSRTDNAYNDGSKEVTVEAGGVIDLYNTDHVKFVSFSGAGTVRNLKATSGAPFTSAKFTNFTGKVEFGVNYTQTNCYFGDGTDSGNDFDWTKIAGLYLGGGTDFTYQYPQVGIRSTVPVVISKPVRGYGTLTTYNDTTFPDIKTLGVYFLPHKSLTIRNGRILASSIDSNTGYFRYQAAGASVIFDGGECLGPYATAADRLSNRWQIKESIIRRNTGAVFRRSSSTNTDKLVITNGATVAISWSVSQRTEVAAGGVSAVYTGWQVPATATTESPCELYYNGGILRALLDYDFGYTTVNLINTPAKAKFIAGPKGMRLDSLGQSANKPSGFTLGVGMRFVSETGTTGPMEYAFCGTTLMNEPWEIAGPTHLLDGWISVQNQTTLKNADGIFGQGALHLGSACLSSGFPTTVPVKLGTVGGVVLDGAASINVTHGAASDSWTLGPLSRVAGGALFLFNDSTATTAFDGSSSHVLIGGTVAAKANGNLTALPVMVMDKYNSQWGNVLWHAKYDATLGVVKSTYTTGIAGGADSVALVGHGTELAADTPATVAGLCVTSTKMNDVAANTTSTDIPTSAATTLKLNAGSTLTVGDGTGTAMVILNGNGSTSLATIKGAGTLAFGGTEGVFSCNARGCGIMSKITGSAGVTFAVPQRTAATGATIFLGGENEYAGGTKIAATRIRPQGSHAFGTGDVTVIGGGWFGGGITFDEGLPDIVITNKLQAWGYGQLRNGVLEFKSDAEWAGDIDISGAVMRVCPVAGEGVLSGTVTGGGLQIYNSATNTFDGGGNEIKAYASKGSVVLTGGANSYSGKTEVIRSTLVLRNGGRTGPGVIELDDALLVIESDVPVTMNALVTGIGTVKIIGKKNQLVSFLTADDDDPFIEQAHTLDLNGKDRCVSSLKGFAKVVNTGTYAATVYARDDADGSFEGEIGENVTLAYGEYHAPGTRILFR